MPVSARCLLGKYGDSLFRSGSLFLGRSGAGTVVETNLVGLPSIYVPLAVGNGEQSRNAAASVAAGASILIPDAEVTAARVIAG